MATKKKTATKKAAPKKAAAKKPAAKKSTSKKTAAKKTTAKKPAAKKSTAKKSAAKKPAAKKPATKKTAAKKTTAKKPAAKKSTAKKAAPKKAAPKKAAAKPAKKAAPKKKKTPFDKKFLDAQKALLLEERAKYIRSADMYKKEADSLVADREPGDVQFDEESGEGDTLAVERERDLALSAQARAAVEEIDAALERIADKTYGICSGSGLAIPKERLRAIPWATERVEYKAGGLGRR